VNQILGAGTWLDQKPQNRETAVQIAAGPKFFNQDPKMIRFVMQNPSDRVTYGDLRMIRSEFDELMQLSVAAGNLKHAVPYETYVDDSFAHNARPATIAL
jgi:NitT/TauT family transport system substrate-binding protein